MSLFELKGKTALVTGGGRGIGRTIALALAEAGADVAVISRTKEELENVCKEISQLSRKSFYQEMDIRETKVMDRFVNKLVDEQGSIDILVNAAGLNVRGSFLELSEEDWDYVMDINLKSVMRSSQVVIPYMREQRQGVVINIASLTSQIGLANMAAYCASKGGVSQLTKAMAVEFAQSGIRVNAIGPGYVRTSMTEAIFQDEKRLQWIVSRIPMGRTADESDLKGVSVFLASQASAYITGQTIYVDGGWLSS